jgi:hypothetical protein
MSPDILRFLPAGGENGAYTIARDSDSGIIALSSRNVPSTGLENYGAQHMLCVQLFDSNILELSGWLCSENTIGLPPQCGGSRREP